MEAEDIRQLMALQAEYGLSLDEGRFDDHMALYAEECRLLVFDRVFEGPERIERFMRRAYRGKHLTGVPSLSFDGDRASSAADFVFFRTDMLLNSAGTYRDEFVRTASGWRFAVRSIEIALRADD